MKDFEFDNVLTFKFKCLVLAFFLVAFIVAFIPLWQLGVDNTLRQQLIASEMEYNELDSEERALRAQSQSAVYDEEINISYKTTNALL